MVQTVDHGELQVPEKIRPGTSAPHLGANGYHIHEVAYCAVKPFLRAPDGRQADDHLVLASVALQQESKETQEDDWQVQAFGCSQRRECPGQLGREPSGNGM